MSDEIEVVEYRNHKIKVYQDEDPECPRKGWDNFGHMICHHPRYGLGDEIITSDEIVDLLFLDWDNRTLRPAIAIALPLVILDHSGLWVKVGRSFGCDPGGWDTSIVGFIYVTKEDIRREYKVKRITKKTLKTAERVLMREVDMYNDYLSGRVYGFMVEGPGCDDSYWGFYGDRGYKEMIEQAKGAIDYYYSQAGEQSAMFPERMVEG